MGFALAGGTAYPPYQTSISDNPVGLFATVAQAYDTADLVFAAVFSTDRTTTTAGAVAGRGSALAVVAPFGYGTSEPDPRHQ